MTDQELKDIKNKTENELLLARQELIMIYPFIGNICMRMQIKAVRDARCRTMCTDGSTIFADCDFTLGLNRDEVLFVLGHEVWHAVLMHMVRVQNRDHELFNIAADKEVNYMLKMDGHKPPKNLLYPEGAEIGESAEVIYEMLLKNQKSPKQTGQIGGLSGQFDRHLTDNEELEQNTYEIFDKWGKVGIDPDFNPSVSKDMVNKIREMAVSSALSMEKRSRGDIPAHISELVKKLLTPEIKWQELLARFVTKCYNGGLRQWLPPNRRHVYRKTYMQSRRSEHIRIALAIDTSGSCENDLGKFLTELNGLVKTFGNYELHIIQCDAAVSEYDIYDDCRPFDPDMEIRFTGGGGTSFKPPFDYILNNGIDVDCMIYMTDGYGDAPDENPIGIPVLWMIASGGTADFCKWGEKIKFKRSV